MDIVERAADSDLQPAQQRIIRAAVEVHPILAVAGRNSRATREGVGNDVRERERGGFIVAPS